MVFLKEVLNIARKRGHITGNQYIWSVINIVNIKLLQSLQPDGTIFSINAKTGYFVGNEKGHSDAFWILMLDQTSPFWEKNDSKRGKDRNR